MQRRSDAECMLAKKVKRNDAYGLSPCHLWWPRGTVKCSEGCECHTRISIRLPCEIAQPALRRLRSTEWVCIPQDHGFNKSIGVSALDHSGSLPLDLRRTPRSFVDVWPFYRAHYWRRVFASLKLKAVERWLSDDALLELPVMPYAETTVVGTAFARDLSFACEQYHTISARLTAVAA